MRDFTWHVFRQTGSIEAYLLLKEMDRLGTADASQEAPSDEEADGAAASAAPP